MLKNKNTIKKKYKNYKNYSRKNIKYKNCKKHFKNHSRKNIKYGGTILLKNAEDQTLRNIVSIGFEFESKNLNYVMHDSIKNKYYLGDSYDVTNKRTKSDKLFQIYNNNFEEFYSQGDEHDVPYLNTFFCDELDYIMENNTKEFVQNNSMKIIKNRKKTDLVVFTENEAEVIDGYHVYLDYPIVEYVSTFYVISTSKNPIFKYFERALNNLKTYLEKINNYNIEINNQTNISISIEGIRSRPYRVKHDLKLYKIPKFIHKYIPSEKEKDDIKNGNETIVYDNKTNNKIINTEDGLLPNINYFYLLNANKNIIDEQFYPQTTFGIIAMEFINVAIKIVDPSDVDCFIDGIRVVDRMILDRFELSQTDVVNDAILDRFGISQFDKNMLIYTYYYSCCIRKGILFSKNKYHLAKYYVTFLLRHKLSDFKIFRNMNFINYVSYLYTLNYNSNESKFDDDFIFDDTLTFYFLILAISNSYHYDTLIKNDNLYTMQNYQSHIENSNSLNLIPYEDVDEENYMTIIERNGKSINAFLDNQFTIPSKNVSFLRNILILYKSFNSFITKQYSYEETPTYDNPLLVEHRTFLIDLAIIARENKLIKNQSNKNLSPLTTHEMLRICSFANEKIESENKPIEQIIPKRKKLRLVGNES